MRWCYLAAALHVRTQLTGGCAEWPDGQCLAGDGAWGCPDLGSGWTQHASNQCDQEGYTCCEMATASGTGTSAAGTKAKEVPAPEPEQEDPDTCSACVSFVALGYDYRERDEEVACCLNVGKVYRDSPEGRPNTTLEIHERTWVNVNRGELTAVGLTGHHAYSAYELFYDGAGNKCAAEGLSTCAELRYTIGVAAGRTLYDARGRAASTDDIALDADARPLRLARPRERAMSWSGGAGSTVRLDAVPEE